MAVQVRKSGEATFIFDRPGDARKVFLVGDFNRWNPAARRMVRAKDGSFRARIQLEPGEYHYKFLVDGAWQHDPDAEQRANPFGTTNSVVRVA